MLVAIALILGFVAGMRTMTAPAVYFLHRGGLAGYVLGVAAIGEYIYDASPNARSRKEPFALSVRVLSGGITGWFVAGIAGAAAGAGGAIAGCYGGSALRTKLIALTGDLPAALIEDAIAIGLAFLAVSRL
jgi:uncharacterized membrane protein